MVLVGILAAEVEPEQVPHLHEAVVRPHVGVVVPGAAPGDEVCADGQWAVRGELCGIESATADMLADANQAFAAAKEFREMVLSGAAQANIPDDKPF